MKIRHLLRHYINISLPLQGGMNRTTVSQDNSVQAISGMKKHQVVRWRPYPQETASHEVTQQSLTQLQRSWANRGTRCPSVSNFWVLVSPCCWGLSALIHFMSFPGKIMSKPFFGYNPKSNFIWLYLEVFFMPWRLWSMQLAEAITPGIVL